MTWRRPSAGTRHTGNRTAPRGQYVPPASRGYVTEVCACGATATRTPDEVLPCCLDAGFARD